MIHRTTRLTFTDTVMAPWLSALKRTAVINQTRWQAQHGQSLPMLRLSY